MKDITSILLTVLGVFLFIAILPTLLWLLLIMAIIIFAVVWYHKWKYRRILKDMEDEADYIYEETKSSSYNSYDDDIIDVEYTERDDN